MTPQEDRLCVAAALARQVVSSVQVRLAIEARSSSRSPRASVTDLLVEQGAFQAEDKEIFLRLLEEKLSQSSDREKELDSLLEPRLREALTLVGDPLVRGFLIDTGALPSPLEMCSRAEYELMHIHNQGGLGQIWLATEKGTHRQLAIKRIKPDYRLESEPRRRFLREAQIIGKLQHPNIVPVYLLGTSLEDHEPYYSMPFIRGRTFDDVIVEYHCERKEGAHIPAQLNRLLAILLKICDAVGYANSCGIIHRDLKPQNVMVGEFGEVFVLDWGLAKSLDEPALDLPAHEPTESGESTDDTATRDGAVLGSPLYMAPEQAAGQMDAMDGRTDVYGLGGMLYKILSGCDPHPRIKSESLLDHLKRIREHPVKPVDRQGARVPPPLAAICHKALSRASADRYSTARQLAQDVERWLVGSPVSVYREPLLQSLARWALVHRKLSTVSAALLVLFVIASAAVAASSWAYSQATASREIEALEHHSLQVTKSIQGDLEWAFRHEIGIADRLYLSRLMFDVEQGNKAEVERWKKYYQRPLEEYLRTVSYFHSVCLFSNADQKTPTFCFDASSAAEQDAVKMLLDPDQPPSLADALKQTSKLKEGEFWCSAPIVIEREQGVPLPVVLGGIPLFHEGRAVGLMVAVIDFRIALKYLAANLQLSEGISITDQEGRPFFFYDLDEERPPEEAYEKVPPLPPSIADFFRSANPSDVHLDLLTRELRRLVCARKVSMLSDRPEPYVGVMLVSDYDRAISEPMAMRGWVAGIVTVVVLLLMGVVWLVIRVLTLLARGME